MKRKKLSLSLIMIVKSKKIMIAVNYDSVSEANIKL